MTRLERAYQTLEALLAARVVVLDGALGTLLQRVALTSDDFGGAAYEGCNEQLVRTRPDVVRDVHHAYLRAGADIIETNTFGGTTLALAEYGLHGQARTLNAAAVQLAREAAERWSTPARPRFVAGAIGPTNRSVSITGGVTFAELTEAFYEQGHALLEGGADLLLLETFHDTRNAKAALLAIDRLRGEFGRIPVMISATLEASGTMLGGQSVEAFCVSVAHADLLSIGVNCSTGPEQMEPLVRVLAATAPTRVSLHPNAGLPDAEGRYGQSAASFAEYISAFLERGWLNIAGGCCGTTDDHIDALSRAAVGAPPRSQGRVRPRACYTGIELVDAEANRPIFVGERANVVGSRAFKRLIAAEQWDEAVEVARDQLRHGARIIDVCLQSADREERDDIPPFYERLLRSVRAPIMIDTTDVEAMDLALSHCQGKSLVNSANLEDGGATLQRVCRVVKRHGATLVLGCIDDDPEQPQAQTRERKLEVARKAYAAATERHGLAPHDIVIDPLVFPCATGDPAYIGAARETVAAIPLIKAHLPAVRTVLGISNVSFGLPAQARRIVDSVFLHHCVEAGLDLAIVNAALVMPYASIPEQERRLAENLLFNLPVAGADDPLLAEAPQDYREQPIDQRVAIARHHVVAVTEYFRRSDAAPLAAAPADLPLDARIARHVIDGTRTGLVEDLDRKRAEGAAALEIINGPLMDGMAEVARLFKDNKVIVAEVLRSAEVMRAAVRHLEQYLEAGETASRGTVVLATVKGDVHDIGKDLVKVILSNNGYAVVDLGTRVNAEALVAASHAHRPRAIGLSGLLVKSGHQMVATAAALNAAGIDVPLLVGGAALSEQFARTKIAPAYGGRVHYASDAMNGLSLLNGIVAAGAETAPRVPEAATPTASVEPAAASAAAVTPLRPKSRGGQAWGVASVDLPPAPALSRHVEQPPLDDVWRLVNPFMLYNRHLGFRGDFASQLARQDPKALALAEVVDAVQRDAATFMRVRAVWQFLEAERAERELRLFAPGSRSPLHVFTFDRQRDGRRLCLTDYVGDRDGGQRDHVALFVATAGAGVRDHATRWNANGEFVKAHVLQALALESAEACAEWVHAKIRQAWGFPDPPGLSLQELFTARYRGKRYSFGYPACPNLDDQRGIFALLQPEDIGVTLTDGMMMEPEASVSGLVFHHPDCEYFAVEPRHERENRA